MEKKTNKQPLISIVIATRNRIPYAISAIKSILDIEDNRLELIIQDNSELRDLEEYVTTNIDDIRFHYRYTPPPFSSIDNFNAALEMATGEYVCLIGDDDGINPEIIEAAVWAKENKVDVLSPRTSMNYIWPDTGIEKTLFAKAPGANIKIKNFSSKLSKINTASEVKKLLKNGGVYYLDFKLPKLYHGLVRRQCLVEIKKRVGNYFEGLSPDIFASLALSQVVTDVYYLDYPLTIPGACPKSTTVDNALGKHTGNIEDAPHFRDRGEYIWNELVPRVYSTETIWVDSGLAALKAMEATDLIPLLNLPKLAAYCIGRNKNLEKKVIRGLFLGLKRMNQNRFLGLIRFMFSFITGPGFLYLKRILNRFYLMIGIRTMVRIHNLENIKDAQEALSNYLLKEGKSFEKCLDKKL